MVYLFRRHFLDHFLDRDRGVGVASDGAELVPEERADEVGSGQAEARFIVPADARLRAGVALHRRAEVPVEGADVVLFDTKPQRVHDADQFLGLGIARAGGGPEGGAGLFKAALLHQVARLFQIGQRGRGEHKRGGKGAKKRHVGLLCGLTLAAPAALAQPITAEDFIAFDADQARIGQLLFYDKILSGNRNISCGTCHHHDMGGTDGLSLGIGEGGVGLGPDRVPGDGADAIRKRIPRNAPALWNLGHKDVRVMFHDGRLEPSDLYGNGFDSPAEEWLPQGLGSLLAAQALFPMTAQFEMAGNTGENEVIGAVHDRIDLGWPILAKRVRTIPEYGEMFVAAFDHIETPGQVTIVEIGNALAAFIGTEWANYDSPYDDFVRDGTPLPAAAERGRQLFFGTAGCAQCHNGPLFTDQAFHAVGLPAFGPGRTRQWDPIPRDVGRMGATDDLEDAYRFRTPSLRNVTLTAPYGHNGVYADLRDMVRHMADPLAARAEWTPEKARLPDVPWLQEIDFVIQTDTLEMARQAAFLDLRPVTLSEGDVDDIVAFLEALTGKTALQRPLGRPETVPSGLPVD
ncbi:cytochrome c peroxidase [Marivita hallyeonensis]|uniref:Cytochrome c peroxidase n=1 Tax=Marivita hallyeonensis TaxID=996342 RepID=A0A1M5X750_9RHOB|nr:cytochrome c peroxidase [Marivita hallyeonensis]